jgi:hypothetical protein
MLLAEVPKDILEIDYDQWSRLRLLPAVEELPFRATKDFWGFRFD